MSAVPHLHVRDDERQPVPGDLPVRPPRQHRELSGPAGRPAWPRSSGSAGLRREALLVQVRSDVSIRLVGLKDASDAIGALLFAAGLPAVHGDDVHVVVG